MGAKGLLRTNEKKKEGFVEEVIGMGFVKGRRMCGEQIFLLDFSGFRVGHME